MRAARVAMTAGAVLLGVAILRAPPMHIGGRAVRVGEAREEGAYVLGGRPVSFSVPDGTRSLRLLVNMDLPAAAPARTPTPVQLRVRLAPDGRDEVFAVLPREAEGGRGFYLDSAKRPSRTTLVGLERDRDVGGALEVSIAGTSTAGGVVRLLELEKRALGKAEPAWVNLPAAAGASRRRVYFDRTDAPESAARAATVASAPDVGSWLEPGRVAAWTVLGPATVTLWIEEGEVGGVARVLAADGRSTEIAVSLSAGRGQSIPLGPGLATLRLASATRARVALSGPATAAGALTHAVALADGRVELRARPSVVEAARCGPARQGAPIIWALAGRRAGEPLRIDARPVVEGFAVPPPASLRWRTLDGDRRVLAQGTAAAAARVSDEDRLLGSVARLSEPTTFYVWPSAGAEALELACDGAVEVTAASPAWLEARDADGDGGEAEREALGLGVTVRLRHGTPPARRRYFGVEPENRGALSREGRLDRMALAPRLEVASPPVSIAAHQLTPVGRPPRAEMLVPDRSMVRVPTQVWALAVGREAPFTTSGGSVSVLYATDPRDAAGSLRVSLDDRVVAQGPLYAARGQLSFAAAAGAHRLRVDAPPSARVFVNTPVAQASLYRRVALHELTRGAPLRLRVGKTTARHVVGVVLYGRGAVGADAALTVALDRGKRAQVGLSRDRTALLRRSALTASPLSSVVLLNTDVEPTWVSRPMFVTLGDDLRPGTHDVALTVTGVTGPVYVRAFGHAVDDDDDAAAGPIAWDLGT